MKLQADDTMTFMFNRENTEAGHTEKHDTLMWFYKNMGLMPGRASKVLIRGYQLYLNDPEYIEAKHHSRSIIEFIADLPRVYSGSLTSTRL